MSLIGSSVLQSATASVTAQYPGGTDFLGFFLRVDFGTPLKLPLSRRPDRYTDAARLSASRSHSSPRIPGSPSSRLHRYPPLPRQVISGNTSSGLYADESNHPPVPPVSSIAAMNSGSIRPTSFLSPGTFVVSYRSCQSESQSHQSMYLRSALNRPKRIAPMKVL